VGGQGPGAARDPGRPRGAVGGQGPGAAKGGRGRPGTRGGQGGPWAADTAADTAARDPGRPRGTVGGRIRPRTAALDDAQAEDLAGDDEALDLAGPFPDLGQLGVAEVALDWEFGDVPVAAVDLDGVVGDP